MSVVSTVDGWSGEGGGERFEEAQVILDKNLFRKPPLVLIIRGYTARCVSVYVCVQTRA